MSTTADASGSGRTTARIEVTGTPATEVAAYAETVGDCHVERRGGRTFLVAES